MAKAAFVVAAAITVIACEEPKEIGLAPTNEVGVLYTDTLTITRTTAQLDSVRSNDQSALLVGRYVDPTLGTVSARAFTTMTLSDRGFVVNDSNTTNATAANRIILDSTRLFLTFNTSWYGDTTVAQELTVTRLADSLRTQNYDISSSVPTAGPVIASRTLRLRPSVGDTTLAIRIDNAIGQELITLANTDAGKYTTTGTLVDPNGLRQKIGRGFALSTSGSAAASIIGLSAVSSGIAVYYHVAGERPVQAPVYFFPFRGKRFNQITANRAGTPLATLRPGQSLTATTTGRTYVQPATGVVTKLQFPSLTALLQSGRIAINRADLVITPQAATDGKLPLPERMLLAEIDAQNRLVRSAASTGAERLFTVQAPGAGPLNRQPNSYVSPQVAFRDPRSNSYTFQVAGYLQSIRAGVSPNGGLAILTPSNTPIAITQSGLLDQTQGVLTDRVWRMVLDGKASVKLVLFYTKSS